jgi:DNA-binding NtrC family response regulator
VSILSRFTVLIVDLGSALANEVAEALDRRGFRTVSRTREEAAQYLSEHSCSILAIRLSPTDLDLVADLRREYPTLCLLTVVSDERLARAAFRSGATESIVEPVSGEELAKQVMLHCPDARSVEGTEPMVGDSDEILKVRKNIRNLAASGSNVLITGETGTGKELTAGLIHRNGDRAGHAFVCINCAGIPDSLLESELFGYERGAFTGAHLSTAGKIELANGGTVFFDEIGEMSPYAQARLLRVIEEKKIYRLGGRKPIQLDIRIIAATNRELDESILNGGFRKDLYFRLNVGRVHLPPLREHKRDILLLVDHYVSEFNQQFRAHVESIEPDVMEHLLAYAWPGNVRELKNVLEGVFISRPAATITFLDLPDWFRKKHPLEQADVSESDRLLSALHATNWNKSEAAGRLNWSRMTLYRKMAKYKVERSA